MKRISRLFKLCQTSSYHSGDHYVLDDEGRIAGVNEDLDILYNQLEERLDLSINSFPKTEEFYKITKLVFRPEDIPIITHIKTGPTLVSDLAKRVGLTEEVCDEKCREMGTRGVISWFVVNEHVFVVVPEYVVGWYEFSLIYFSEPGRIEEYEEFTGESFDDLNRMMKNYLMMYSPTFDVDLGLTTVLRTTPLHLDDGKGKKMEVVPYETLKGMMEESNIITVANCACKFHETVTTGVPLPDDIPLKCCYQIDESAEGVLNLGLGEEVSLEDCLEQLEHLRDTGHMFNVENNKESQFFCSCHKEWCGCRKIFEENGHYLSHRSGFIPLFDEEKCIGCSVCVDRCPVDVLQMVELDLEEDQVKGEGKKKKKKKKVRMVSDDGLETCVGCLSCYWGCKVDAISYDRRSEEDVYSIPEDLFEFGVRSAWERGMFHTLMFDDPQSKAHKWLRSVGKLVECNPIVSDRIKGNKKFSNWVISKVSKFARKDFLKSVGLSDDE